MKLQIKVMENGISYKKLCGRTCLSKLEMEFGGLKVEILICTDTGK